MVDMNPSPPPPTTTDTAITADGLTKRFGDLTALHDITLEIPSGGVVGFVGPNGSGKSTFIRTLLGLLSPTSGTGTVLGRPIDDPASFADDVGALIENPAFVGSISARDNLRSLAALRGLPGRRVDEVLDVVGLTGRDRDRASTYSLGMKQRLGIAAALLADPRLLMLDEPTNGLDPAGIVEIRALLRRLAAEGRTVIVSSHLLGEIQAACDGLVVVRFGELVYSGGLDELMARAAEHVVATPDHEADLGHLADVYRSHGWDVERVGPSLSVRVGADFAVGINALAIEHGVILRELRPVQQSLEDVFLDMTGATDAELSAARGAQHHANDGEPQIQPTDLVKEAA